MKSVRKVLSAPFQLLHQLFGILAAAILGTLGIAGGLILAAGVVAVLLFAVAGALVWLLCSALLVMGGGILAHIARVLDPTYLNPTLADKLNTGVRRQASDLSAMVH